MDLVGELEEAFDIHMDTLDVLDFTSYEKGKRSSWTLRGNGLNNPYPDRIFRIVEPVTESNCYVIREEDKCMIIDPNDFTAIRELLQKWGLMPGWSF